MSKTLRLFLFVPLLFLWGGYISNEQEEVITPVRIEESVVLKGDTAWARAKLNQMTLDEKLGQLFMVAAYSNKGEAHKKEILRLVRDEKIGGLIFFQGGPVRQARLTNTYQQAADIPLMIAMDAEWGLAMRLDSTYKFPWPMTMGAMTDSTLAYEAGKQIALHCRRLGVHINFAPVVDINTNPNNPIINARSFGEDKYRVVKMSAAYMKGMQDQNVLACAKHFPGHGDTDKDSHKTLPTVDHDFKRLNDVELYPYHQLMKMGLGSVMAAHLNVPALDNSGKPSSLSPMVIQKFLKDSLKFRGLVFTDALNMQGVAKFYKPGEVDLEAFRAGNDILLFSQDVGTAKAKIKEAITSGKITEADVNDRVFRVLTAKSWMGLEEKFHVEPSGLVEDLNPEESDILNRNIYKKSVTVLKNRERLLPIGDLRNKKIACVTAGVNEGSAFPRTLRYFTSVDQYSFSGANTENLLNKLASYDIVIMAIYTSNANPWKSYKIAAPIKSFIKRLSYQNKIVLDIFANPYSLGSFKEASLADALIMSYQNHPDAESISAQIIFGSLGASGRLPVSASESFEVGFGINTESFERLRYGLPGEVGLDADVLNNIDEIVENAIESKAMPGAQVIVARKGMVVYQKAFGHQTYARSKAIDDFSVYDIASITKIAATVPMLMKLVEENKIDLEKTLGDYLPELKGTNKEKLVIREVLAHQAGLKPWIPFYTETMEKGNLKKTYYSNERNFNYPNVVAGSLYSHRFIRDTLYQRIYDSDLLPRKSYKYSDLGYYLFMKIIERIEGKSIDQLVQDYFYQSLGAYSTTYKPLEKFEASEIVPTENDKVFRKRNLRGYVHDQGAAMLGGVAGHAGIFSNANDLCKIMQMYLNEGSYGGVNYFDSITMNEFTSCPYCDSDNRRGIGFDKPQLEGQGPTCGCVSSSSFGHSGFTGTITWADPEEEIIYIFFSNRVHPDANNRKLLSLSTRTRIQKVIYDAIQKEDSTQLVSPVIEP